MNTCEVIQVIKTTLKKRGTGTASNPIRYIEQYWTLNGVLLFEQEEVLLQEPVSKMSAVHSAPSDDTGDYAHYSRKQRILDLMRHPTTTVVQAVKLHRDLFPEFGLLEAKNRVDAWYVEYGIPRKNMV